MATFFIADTHFSEENIMKYENRPFASVEDMDEQMIERWNARVCEEDLIYVLGDFGATGREQEYLSRLNGNKYLVKGNHDVEENEYYRKAGFQEVYDCPILLESFWILSHEPQYVNENMPYANLFGHVHNSPLFKDFSRQHYCVSVERTEFAPISFEEVKRCIKDRF
ncbi:MAG: metallophosphoesterase [Lachnospiraceae bacterium]|nr:metallophosphoesterase [Lachnospiraceae bacterium]